MLSIGFALKGSSGGSGPVKLYSHMSAIAVAPETVLSGAPVEPAAPPPSAANGGLAPLTSPPSGASKPEVRAQPHPSAIASAPFIPSATPTIPPAIASFAKPPPYDGIECQRARQWRAMGRMRAAEQQALICIAKGGTP